VRLDSGYEAGDTVSQYYDNLVAKLIVWGQDREAARRRMLRALAETTIEGIATTIPAHVAILSHEDFIAVRHSTRWVEDSLDPATFALGAASLPSPAAGAGDGEDEAEALVMRQVTAEVDGRRYEVKLWVPETAPSPGSSFGAAGVAGASARGRAAPKRARHHAASMGTGSGTVTVPMQGTIVKVLVAVGDQVAVGQTVCVLEAMKMENTVNAEKAGTVAEVRVSSGDSVGPGDVVAIIE
jgi:acetyl-CoA/propionyl-CoA carboxylase biotin carboxyl carrier protein